MDSTKHCARCGEEKDASEFFKDVKMRGGLDSHCKACNRASWRNWAERSKQRNRAVNPDSAIIKRCAKCQREKPQTEFHRCLSSKDGFSYACKDCRRREARERNADRRKLQPEKIQSQRRISGRRHRYGLTAENTERLLASQGNRCPGCMRPIGDDALKFDVDHCHQTRTVRGLLCRRCNIRVAVLEDEPVILERLLVYLRENTSERPRTSPDCASDATPGSEHSAP